MQFEIINPHDPYTLEAPDFLTALTAIALIGEGKYGIRGEAGTAPPVLFDDWSEDVYRAAGVSSCTDIFDPEIGYLNTNPAFNEAVAVACESIRCPGRKTSTVDLEAKGKRYAEALRSRRTFASCEE